MNSDMPKKKTNPLLVISFIVPACTYVIAALIELREYGDINIDLLKTIVGLAISLSVVCLGFFGICLANCVNKKGPLIKNLIAAGLNIGAFLFVAYAVGPLY